MAAGNTPSDKPVPLEDDVAVIAALRRGDESVFVALVDRYHHHLVRLAMVYVDDRDVAEEVVQDTWLGVLNGIDRFEGRSSLKTWMFRILMNRARTRATRERRTVPLSSLTETVDSDDAPAVDPERFFGPDNRLSGHWASPPASWDALPESRLLSAETLAVIEQAIAALPPQQREVIILRDIEGWGAHEVCNVLEISETNQRVLLHRARSRVRRALEQHVDEAGSR
jgi:RNA polymerase sigma-70 factor, ECF subfamily